MFVDNYDLLYYYYHFSCTFVLLYLWLCASLCALQRDSAARTIALAPTETSTHAVVSGIPSQLRNHYSMLIIICYLIY